MENKKYLIFSVLIFAFVCVFYAMAWTGPTNTPPNDNAPAPINVSDSAQQKDGAFSLKKYLRLIPSQSSAISETDDGIMFYDVSNNAFRCRENGNWLNCVGGFFTKTGQNIISLLDFGSGLVRIGNVATPLGDDDNEVATVGYVKAQSATASGFGGTRWFIKPTPGKHDGNFGGWPGIDKYCQQQINSSCVVFSSDIFNSAYVADEHLDFGSWDIAITTLGWWGQRGGVSFTGTASPNPAGYWSSNGTCNGWTVNAVGTNGYMFNNAGLSGATSPCSIVQNVICACLVP